jgi:hypothetical protein
LLSSVEWDISQSRAIKIKIAALGIEKESTKVLATTSAKKCEHDCDNTHLLQEFQDTQR